MKALDPLKLLGTTLSQSLAQDGEAESEKAHMQYIKGLGMCMTWSGNRAKQPMSSQPLESNSQQTAQLLSWEEAGRWHVWQGLILGETLCVAKPGAYHYPERT